MESAPSWVVAQYSCVVPVSLGFASVIVDFVGAVAVVILVVLVVVIVVVAVVVIVVVVAVVQIALNLWQSQ